MSEQLLLLPGYLSAHLQLSLCALALGFSLSLPLGIWLTRRRDLEPAALGVVSVIQTIPSLALLALMVPTLAALSVLLDRTLGITLSSIGFLPALIALTLYSMLPILRNTVTGIRGVDPSVVEAGRAAGMTERQLLANVELPLALPVIVAGVRTAAVWVVGTATLSTPVGATSLGNFIFSGLQTRNFAAVWVGSIAAAGLALLLDALIHALQVGLQGRRRTRILVPASLLLALYGFTAASFAWGPGRGGEPIVIGSKTFTEQYILSELLARQIRRATGLPSHAVHSLGSTIAFDALRTGELDVYVDYSGTIWATVMKRTGERPERARLLREVGRYLQERHGITLVGALGFENTYALGMRREHTRELDVTRISELAAVASALEIGGDYEFFARQEWTDLERVYGLSFRKRRSMDSSLMYQALRSGDVDVISAFSTDGRIQEFDIVLLEDDRAVIPPYDAVILAGPGLVKRHPEAIKALRQLTGRIDAEQMRALNRAVDREGRSPGQVAQGFLKTLGSAP